MPSRVVAAGLTLRVTGREPRGRTQRQTAMVGKYVPLAAMVCGLLVGCGSERTAQQPVTTLPSRDALPTSTAGLAGPSTTAMPAELQGSIEFIGVSLDGRSITVLPLPSPEGCAAYQRVSNVESTQTDDSITVRVLMLQSTYSGECIEPAVFFDPVVVPLEESLGDRAVIDAAAPDVPLVPTIPPGQIEVAFRLDVDEGVAIGPVAPDGAFDIAYLGRVPSAQPLAESVIGGLATLAQMDRDAFTLVMAPEGETIWLGLGRQSPPDGGPFEPRDRNQLASVEIPLPPAPGLAVTGQQMLLRLEPGAFVTGERPSIDPTKVSLTWIEPPPE